MTENLNADVRQFTAELVAAAMAGACDDVADALIILGRAPSSRVPAVLVGELVGRCAAAVRARHPGDADAIFTVAVEDDREQPVEVECLPPALLAALRALLADLGGDEESREIQVELATRGDVEEVVGVATHLLVWLVELSATTTGTLPPLSCFPR
ncbi:hypothetical protein M8542_32420 [Amycolatopsis sp. OK19-0408]|uniref:Uncharacterized protein n=1 Tax=Amycolatopsis iheyensis TaxID=2945988 RepID=A0A9X2NGT5_9PSEU|nr:hypothetical protein [Amycolatopsis iheyensis]MCR6487543.1 hypothetical protein [Amycolatopsis iheyensis]